MHKADRSPVTALIALPFLLVAIPALYFGCYVALHQHAEERRLSRTMTFNGTAYVQVAQVHCYRIGEGYINPIFWPAEQLHEWLYPEEWNTQEVVLPDQ